MTTLLFVVAGYSYLQGVLQTLHESHQGSIHTKERARLVYWPGIDNDIDNVILTCKRYQDALPSNWREPIITKSKPERPFQELAGDFCCYGGQYYISSWSIVARTGLGNLAWETVASKLISALQHVACRVPDIF